MRLTRWVALAVFAIPIAELITFAVVAAMVGFVPAFLTALLTSVVGVIILRQAGRAQLARIRAVLANGPRADLTNAGGTLNLLAGLLLVIPGFITDVLGALLLIPSVQSRLLRIVLVEPRPSPRAASRDAVLDLDPDEWHRVPNSSNGRKPVEITSPNSGTRFSEPDRSK